jgi:signal recognition particle receptor subunit beta
MDASRELKIVFTGPMGAGKTTAIAAISDVPPVSTDVANNDLTAFDKESTTVALDYGHVSLDGGMVVRLYGTPGQQRFDFMRSILWQGALGVVLLLDGSRSDALEQLDAYLAELQRLDPLPAVVVGIGRCQSAAAPLLVQAARRVEGANLTLPVFGVDVRQRADALLLIETLVCLLEAQAGMEAHA